MGNARSSSEQFSPPLSSSFEEEAEDLFWQPQSFRSIEIEVSKSTAEATSSRQKRIKEELDEFKLELARKHEKRRQIIAEKHKEMQSLRDEVHRLQIENDELRQSNNKNSNSDYSSDDRSESESRVIANLREENEELRSTIAKLDDELSSVEEIKRKNLELKMTIAETQKELQDLNTEVFNFEQERADYKNHVVALKDVIAVSKQMLIIRENQLKELKQKVNEIEASLAGRDLTVLSQDLQKEYEKQMQNMQNLRIFYEERLRAHNREKHDLKIVLDGTKKELEEEQVRNKELKDNIERLETENSTKYDEIKALESNLGLSKAEGRQLQAELAVINQLFSQILLGFNNNQDVDVDKLIKLLEENHMLLQDIAVNEVSNAVASTLPKVLLDLVSEARDKSNREETNETGEESEKDQDSSSAHQMNSASEIVENLPKVWRILIELLSHQSAPVSTLTEGETKENRFYKIVETPKGTQLALSVSKTFIRLKDLILEKKSLERETYKLKHLNTHLESRLQEQEKRLETVSVELSETWHVVGKLQKKHQMLHTQEKILRYELAQKRKLLTELREELEYSREKWLEAREKNSTTEKQWQQLRSEFASRKNHPAGDDFHNSVESGYSDGRECSSEDEPGYETDVSECNQKLSSGEDAEADGAPPPGGTDQVVEDDAADSHIVDVIQEEIETIEEGAQASSEKTEAEDLVETVSDDEPPKSLEKVLSAREERLQRLEGQCSNLVKQMANTSTRGTAISNKLDALHEIYGETSSRRTEDDADNQESTEEDED